MIATAASILATAGLGLIAWVPLVGLAVLPLQAAAWLLRGIVFEYLALAGEAVIVAVRNERVPARRSKCAGIQPSRSECTL